ncbi:hypothetical protein HAX54_019667, partial [Datura stramonium]|nr:hypothetical protein [Datura stramonium]
SSAISKTITNLEQILKSDGDTDNIIFESFEAAKQSIEELKREFDSGSKASQEIDGQIITNIDERVDTGVSPNSIIGELRERGSVETQEHETQQKDDSC